LWLVSRELKPNRKLFSWPLIHSSFMVGCGDRTLCIMHTWSLRDAIQSIKQHTRRNVKESPKRNFILKKKNFVSHWSLLLLHVAFWVNWGAVKRWECLRERWGTDSAPTDRGDNDDEERKKERKNESVNEERAFCSFVFFFFLVSFWGSRSTESRSGEVDNAEHGLTMSMCSRWDRIDGEKLHILMSRNLAFCCSFSICL
jgi:hypothetical protein